MNANELCDDETHSVTTVVSGLTPRKHGSGQGLDPTSLSPRTNMQPWKRERETLSCQERP